MTTILRTIFRTSEPRADIRRDWDELRARAMSPTELAEIDAIFSRYA